MTSGPEFLADAADELVAAATRVQRKRRTNKRFATGASAAIVVATGSLIAFGAVRSNDARAEHVTIAPGAGGFQLVTIAEHSPASDVIAELGRAAIAVNVEELHVGPSRVGVVLGTSSSGTRTPSGAYLLPAGAAITVTVGVKTPADGEYDTPSVAFDPGEPLHCLGQMRGDAAALAKRIPPDVDVSWLRGLGDGTPITKDDLAGTTVAMAFSTKANTVTINVVDGIGPAEPPAC